MDRLLRAHLVEFDLSLRILIPLEDAGVKRLGDLVKHSRKSLESIRNIGKTSADTLEKLLDRLGLALRQE